MLTSNEVDGVRIEYGFASNRMKELSAVVIADISCPSYPLFISSPLNGLTEIELDLHDCLLSLADDIDAATSCGQGL